MTSPTKRPRGRPSDGRTEALFVRASGEELARWRAAAAADDRDLSSWARRALDRAAEAARNEESPRP